MAPFKCLAIAVALIFVTLGQATPISTEASSTASFNEHSTAQVITSCSVPGTFAITFDNGPDKYTDTLLDFLAKNQYKATFFVNGDNYGDINDLAPVVKKAYAADHQIASNTWSNADLTTLSLDGIKQEMDSLDIALKDIIGFRPVFMRPPYGSVNETVLQILGDLGYKVITWDVDSGDYAENASLETEQNNYKTDLQGAKPATDGHISLQHDTLQNTVDKLVPWAFDYVQGLGYRTVTVGECLAEKRYPGPIVYSSLETMILGYAAVQRGDIHQQAKADKGFEISNCFEARYNATSSITNPISKKNRARTTWATSAARLTDLEAVLFESCEEAA
ncbi:hypothetical protein BGX27_000948 [Mortierella sp. AM989]|nr:hypothetical protein BGX27_000948 [Mortierella sp. AM989]